MTWDLRQDLRRRVVESLDVDLPSAGLFAVLALLGVSTALLWTNIALGVAMPRTLQSLMPTLARR